MKGVLKFTSQAGQIPKPPPDYGRLMNAEEVAAELFDGAVSVSWVKKHLQAGRVRLGHSTVRWYEKPVREWIVERMTQEAI
jgi:hypothetical protein